VNSFSSFLLREGTKFNPNCTGDQKSQAVQSNASSIFSFHLRMGNIDFRVSFFRDYPPVLPKRIPKIVLGMPKKFHVDSHCIASKPAQLQWLPCR